VRDVSSVPERIQLEIKVKRTGPVDVELPAYQTDGAAGMDLRAALREPITLNPRERQKISTGLAIALPRGFEAQVRPRSGLAWRHGITVLNSPGTVDSDYRGAIEVVLINHGDEPVTIAPQERIAQLVFAQVAKATLHVVTDLDETERGAGGYGSTGSR
jgi:dUTP pyrophosphatase